MRSSRHALLLAGVLALAVFLRFWHVRPLGIFTIDEGRYTLDALAKLREFEVWTNLFAGKWREIMAGDTFLLSETLPRLHTAMTQNTVFFSKGLAAYATGFAMLFTGYTTWTGNSVEALCGVLTIALAYGWVRRLSTPRTALIAALILTLSVYHGYFARNSYPQALPGLLLIASLWLHTEGLLRGQIRWHFLAGLGWGLGFWASYQLTLFLPAMAAVHVLVCMAFLPRVQGLRLMAGGGLLWLLGHAFALFLAEAASYPTLLLFRQEGLLYPHRTFLQLQLPRVFAFLGLPADPAGLVYFPFLLWRAEGWGILALSAFALAVAAAATRKDRTQVQAWRPLAYFAPLTLIPYLIAGTRGMWNSRPYMLFLPMAAALAAITLAWALDRTRAWRFAACLAIAAYAATALPGQAELLRMRSGYPEVMAWLERQDEPAACASYGTLLAAYLAEAGLAGGSYESLKGGPHLPPCFIEDASQLHYKQIPGAFETRPPGAQVIRRFPQRIGPVFLAMEGVPRFGPPFEGLRYIASLDPQRCGRIWVYRLPPAITNP